MDKKLLTKNELETMNKEQLINIIFTLQEESKNNKFYYEQEQKDYKELHSCLMEEKIEKRAYKKQLEDIKKILN